MKFFVNFLSCFRILAAFAIIPTIMYGMYWTTFILYTVAGFSDLFDGWLARKYNVTSKLGGVLDHIGDKLLVSNTLIMLVAMMPIWYIIIPVIVMIARELYVSGLREFLGTQKIEMPVPKSRFSMGKVKNTLQMVSIGAFLLIFVLGTLISPDISNKIILYSIITLPHIALWGLWLSMVASIWSAIEYTITFAKKFKTIKIK